MSFGLSEIAMDLQNKTAIVTGGPGAMMPFGSMVSWVALPRGAVLAQDRAQDRAKIASGKVLYQQWCVSCHGAGPGHPGTQALDFRYKGALPAALEDRTNLTPDFVKVVVRNGISVMPFFRKTEISDSELAEIGAYLSRSSLK